MTSEEREAKNAYKRQYRADHPEYRAKGTERMKKYHSEHKEESKAYNKKNYSEHREERIKYQREYYAAHREEYNEWQKRYRCIDLNSFGHKKSIIRAQSRALLFKTHVRLKEYQIHHCFTYDDPSKFIYIPRSLHYQIHQVLRDLNIPAYSDHWNIIRDLVNTCEEYTYIRC